VTSQHSFNLTQQQSTAATQLQQQQMLALASTSTLQTQQQQQTPPSQIQVVYEPVEQSKSPATAAAADAPTRPEVDATRHET
jgi:hypothetical protein